MKNHKLNWLLDLAILLGFLVSFFLKLTGLAVHQWLGVAVFLGIIFHLVNHLEWIKNVFSRFFGKTTNRARIYALIDGFLLYGFILIIETGLVISTWFNLNLASYEVWLDIHILYSVSTLLLTILKLGLHWRWIAKTARKIFSPTSKLTSQVLTTTSQVSSVSRRDFLATMGLIGLGSAIAISNVLPLLKKVEVSSDVAQAINPAVSTPVAQAQSTTAVTQQQTAAAVPSETSTTVPTVTATPTIAPTATSEIVASSSLVCYETCPKRRHCSFPGDCRRYTDSNGNGLCDLGECN